MRILELQPGLENFCPGIIDVETFEIAAKIFCLAPPILLAKPDWSEEIFRVRLSSFAGAIWGGFLFQAFFIDIGSGATVTFFC